MSKYCINCKHFVQSTYSKICNRSIGISLVTGEMEYRNIDAKIERGLDLTGCGSVGKHYESILSEIPFGEQA
jgi:hypothetical protein